VRWIGRPGLWLAASLAAAALARAGAAPRAAGGLAIGFAVGAGYLWLLVRRAASLPGLPPRRALVAAQAGAVLRFGFVFAGFALAARAWPQASLGWAAGALLLPLGAAMLVLARGGGG
jgi:hypothetical protein